MLPNLWDLAVRSLDDDIRQLIDFEHVDELEVLREVTRLADEKKNQCVRSRIRIRRKNGEVIIVRDVFEKIVKYVQKFREIGDVAVQYDPAHASLPWAGVRLLLQFAISETQTFSLMVEGLGQVTNLIARYAIMEDLYLREQTNAARQLEASLIQLYAATLVFLGKTYHFFSQSATRRIIKSIFTLSEEGLQQLLQDIYQKQGFVDQAALLIQGDRQQSIADGVFKTNIQAFDISQNVDALSRTVLSDNTIIRKDVNILLQLSSELKAPMHRIASQLFDLSDDHDASRRAAVLSWLSDIPYEQHHETSRKGRHLGSGEWLLQKPEYEDWRISSFSSILWLHGIPGSGKTTLVSRVIDNLDQEIAAGRNLPPIAYFYCARDSAEPERSKPEEVLLSIARQLSGRDLNFPIRAAANEKYLAMNSFRRRRLTLQEAVDLILSITHDDPVTILIDALDECDPLHRHELLEAFDTIIQQSANIVKIFVSSREDNDIVCKLESSPNLYISADDNKKDIEEFIRVEVAEAITKKRLLNGKVSPHLRQLIIDRLEKDAQGMFRWVSLQIQNLCDPWRMKLEEDILRELGKLPKSLSELYAVIYDQIENSGHYSRRMAERLMQWLIVAQQPLSVDMAIAVVLRENPNVGTSLGYRDLLNVTCNMIVIEKEVVRFAHLSVREYLESRANFSKDEVHMRAAMICLDEYARLEYPLHIPIQPAKLESGQIRVDTVLRGYSCSFWPFHVAQVHREPQRSQLHGILRRCILRSVDESRSFKEWRKHIENWPLQIPFVIKLEIRAARTPFIASCIFGFTKILESYEHSEITAWSRKQIAIYEGRYSGMNGLHITIYQGHPDCTRLLLDRGADVNDPTASGETCLHIAVRKERRDLLQLLINFGANTNALSFSSPKNEIDWTESSYWTGRYDYKDTDRPRLRSSLGFRTGAGSINSAIDAPGETPIHYAALHGAFQCVCELLRLGADVNVRNSQGDTPLLKALEGWHDNIVYQLLHAGADVNVRSLYGRTPLHFAAASGQYDTAMLLVRYGANPHLHDFLGSSPIQVARRYHNEQLANTLEASTTENRVDVYPQEPIMLDAVGTDLERNVESPSLRPANIQSPDIVYSDWNELMDYKLS